MTARIALALSFIVLAALAHPWQTTTDWWLLGGAVSVVVIVFAWWRGLFVTSMIGRRLAIWRRNHSKPAPRNSDRATVLLRVEPGDYTALPVPVIAGYVDRFGIRCDNVRITSLDRSGTRHTWIGLTIGATDNLAALRARSSSIPLYDTAEIVGRRLADQLREAGVETTVVDTSTAPLVVKSHETWRGVRDDDGFLSVYAIKVDAGFADRLAAVSSSPSQETWSAIEFGGIAAHLTIAGVCAFRTDEAPTGTPPAGIIAQYGHQVPLLTALDPRSIDRLNVPVAPLSWELLQQLVWRTDAAASDEHEVVQEAGHPA